MAISLSSNHLPFHGLVEDPAKSTKNSTAETLLAIAQRKGEGSIASNGAFAAFTGAHTGRSPNDKFIIGDDETTAVVAINFKPALILIGGTRYAGEIKKSIFTVLNSLLPRLGVLPMHCSANRGVNGETALFFGLSGTGKTTLSADPDRHLIGDDEHGWSDAGIFNFEGGCYAKCIHLSKEREPQIWSAIRRGAVLENVVLDKESKVPDYDDDSITENTRAAYPLDFIDNAVLPSVGGHPKNIFFLTADAFGVLPAIARLNSEHT